MSAPAAAVRSLTYWRDGERCVSCGAFEHKEYQHRQVVGMGGSKILPTFPEGLTSCHTCNDGYENRLQGKALRYGWKVRGWVQTPGLVPVFYAWEREWYVLGDDGRRRKITAGRALEMMLNVYGAAYEQMMMEAGKK